MSAFYPIIDTTGGHTSARGLKSQRVIQTNTQNYQTMPWSVLFMTFNPNPIFVFYQYRFHTAPHILLNILFVLN